MKCFFAFSCSAFLRFLADLRDHQDTKVQIMQPLLAEEFITYARNLPLYGKIRGSDDMLRKHAIRDLALKIGVPEISARKRKKALQYGTLIHKNLIKSKLLRE